MRLAALALAALTSTAFLAPGAAVSASQSSDLDAFMARVLAERDVNWQKMQQYVLDEDERLQVTGPDGSRLFGFRRTYTWFIRDGIFVRSPLTANGVSIGEDERAAAERRWLARERAREKARERRAQKAAEADGAKAEVAAETEVDAPADRTVTVSPAGVSMDVVSSTLEPRFVSAAYFLRFKFDPGRYALAGRERIEGRDVLRIEYYPTRLFTEGRTKPDKRVRDRDDEIEEKMNKVSIVTLWIDPAAHQILRYTFDNVGMDFIPGGSVVRVNDARASMEMVKPFPDVWLPGTITMQFGATTAIGELAARYDVRYHDYRLAAVTSKVRPPGQVR